MRRSGLGILILVLTGGCKSATDPGPSPTRFASPIAGRPLAELFYGAYIDEGGRDYFCGTKFYGGHRGTDILLRSFRTQDSGVTVIAAAAGKVQSVHDGEPDRNSVQDASKPWNYVAIQHPDGLTSYYGHLRRGSLRVATGESVAAGTPLGLVGSSGFSNWPHLHFEVRSGTSVIDPWEGKCSPGKSMWSSQLPYQDGFKVLDTGILDRRADGLADLLERPADDEPVTGSTGVVSFWAELYNVRANPLRAEFYAPDGFLVGAIEYPLFVTFSATFALLTLPSPGTLPRGRYTVVLLTRPLSGGAFEEITRRSFTLALAATPGQLRLAEVPRAATIRLFESGGDGPGIGVRPQR